MFFFQHFHHFLNECLAHLEILGRCSHFFCRHDLSQRFCCPKACYSALYFLFTSYNLLWDLLMILVCATFWVKWVFLHFKDGGMDHDSFSNLMSFLFCYFLRLVKGLMLSDVIIFPYTTRLSLLFLCPAPFESTLRDLFLLLGFILHEYFSI